MKFIHLCLFSIFLWGCGRHADEASNLSDVQLKWRYLTEDNLSFNDSDKALIKRGMNVLSARIDNNKVWQCARSNYKRWMVRNSGQDIDTIEKFRAWVVEHMSAFKDEVPRINLYPYNENSSAAGHAQVGGFVKAKFLETTSLVPIYQLKGEFKLGLNVKQMRSNTWNDDPDMWAGVIAHEMLHQMGYSHDDGNYEDDMFITVFGDCVQNNGVYHSRKEGLGLTGKAFPIPD